MFVNVFFTEKECENRIELQLLQQNLDNNHDMKTVKHLHLATIIYEKDSNLRAIQQALQDVMKIA